MKIYSFLAIPMLMLGVQCADESEENQFYKSEKLEEYQYDENPVTKEAAIENWEIFLEESQDLLFQSHNNLEAFQYEIEAANDLQKFELLKDYSRYKKAIENLERKRQQRIDAFDRELKYYDQKNHKSNEDFKKAFKREIIRINLGLDYRANDRP